MEADDHLPLSALSHLIYCPRRVALVHVLDVWVENAHTTHGKLVHERVDGGESSSHDGVHVLRSVHVRSDRLRLRGVIDALEVHADGAAVRLVPIETKRGARRQWDRDDVQLCAQAMALEEMSGVAIAEGAIFHAASKRRRVVAVSAELREQTAEAARRLHEIVARREIPPPVCDARCEECSLEPACQPHARSLARTLREAVGRSLTTEPA